VAIPTTSGTGSEVTSFAVITDKNKGNTKYPLADYELTPDVAIVDPDFVLSLPKTAVADTGMDVLTHAIEAYVSVMANDYTDGLALKAIQLVFENLEDSYHKADPRAREKMHNASTIAGMAFANAFLGINHSLAHKWGGQYHTAHGRTNAILMPHVIRYNASKPTKFAYVPEIRPLRRRQALRRHREVARAPLRNDGRGREQPDPGDSQAEPDARHSGIFPGAGLRRERFREQRGPSGGPGFRRPMHDGEPPNAVGYGVGRRLPQRFLRKFRLTTREGKKMATTEKNLNEAAPSAGSANPWRGFRLGKWQLAVDVNDFIGLNLTPYEEDERFRRSRRRLPASCGIKCWN